MSQEPRIWQSSKICRLLCIGNRSWMQHAKRTAFGRRTLQKTFQLSNCVPSHTHATCLCHR